MPEILQGKLHRGQSVEVQRCLRRGESVSFQVLITGVKLPIFAAYLIFKQMDFWFLSELLFVLCHKISQERSVFIGPPSNFNSATKHLAGIGRS